jgi:hypothetical protein
MTAALVAVLLTGAFLTGCGSSEERTSNREDDVQITPAARVMRAASESVDAGSAKIDMTMSMRGGDIPAGTTFSITGVQNFDTGDVEMRIDYGELLAGAPPDQRYASVRVVDGVMYMRFPDALTEELGLERPWLRLDVGDLQGEGGASALSETSSQADPGQYLTYLSGVSDDVEELGTEDVRGVTTTRYRATIDFARALDEGAAIRDKFEEMGPDIEEQLEELAAAGVTIPTDVWIDGDGLLRKLRMRMSGAGLAAVGMPADADVTVTMELYDYGTPASVTLPPAEEITDWTEAIAALGPNGTAARQ